MQVQVDWIRMSAGIYSYCHLHKLVIYSSRIGCWVYINNSANE